MPEEEDVATWYHGIGLSQENELLLCSHTDGPGDDLLTEGRQTENNRMTMTSLRSGI